MLRRETRGNPRDVRRRGGDATRRSERSRPRSPRQRRIRGPSTTDASSPPTCASVPKSPVQESSCSTRRRSTTARGSRERRRALRRRPGRERRAASRRRRRVFEEEYADIVRRVFGAATSVTHVFANSKSMDASPVFASSARIQARLHAVCRRRVSRTRELAAAVAASRKRRQSRRRPVVDSERRRGTKHVQVHADTDEKRGSGRERGAACRVRRRAPPTSDATRRRRLGNAQDARVHRRRRRRPRAGTWRCRSACGD